MATLLSSLHSHDKNWSKVVRALKQQKAEAELMRRIVNAQVSRGEFPRWLTRDAFERGFFTQAPSAALNPYTGMLRYWAPSGDGGFFGCEVHPKSRGAIVELRSPLQDPCNPAGSIAMAEPSDPRNVRGGFVFMFDLSSMDNSFRLHFADGTRRRYAGWTFVETDMNGGIVAAQGGGIGEAPID